MHVTLISACERRAVKRSRAVLDSYAIRTGERSWATPITLEGLRELRSLLKGGATRQTAVACYRNEGRERMRLLWVVGSRDAFGPDGHFPAGYTRRVRRPPPLWLRVVGLLAHAAGLTHDFGKAGNFFADKLARAVASPGARGESDPVRHEWISMRLLQSVRKNCDWSQAWAKIAKPNRIVEMDGLDERGLQSARDALDYVVATHHRLFGPKEQCSRPTAEKHVDDKGRAAELQPAGTLPEDVLDAFGRVFRRLESKAGDRSPAFWRGVATLARAALVLADHEVSSRQFLDGPKGRGPYANTYGGQFNQPLGWHLQTVGRRAADLAWRMNGLRLPGLATETVEHILTPADEKGRFAWQNRAVAAISGFRDRNQDGMLIFNIAATGAGKTIANAKIACSLSSRPRFAIALNLRSLTLQTGDALRDDMGLGEDELAIVIGDRVAEKLHAASKLDRSSADTFETEGLATEYDARGGEVVLPEWMKVLIDSSASLRPVIGAPVLVSTIDYLINAGEPGRQGHHVGALLRMADSDLVLDEVDAYDPDALVAVLRLVQVAGLMGRNVICSSATLPLPVADAVHRAFRSGVEMRCAMEVRETSVAVAIVDDQTAPSVFSSDAGFADRFSAHVASLLAVVRRTTRRAYVQPVSERSMPAFQRAVLDAVRRLHKAHRWGDDKGRSLSFGLVRVANIRIAIATARALADALPHAMVACYHARDFRIQRHLKEKRLDFLLGRKRGNGHILGDEEIRRVLASSSCADVPFIVVATPVEEIGRDHDFDWGVIEPSSAHSIVQAAGRINRHRLIAVSEPNVAILQYNARWAEGQACDAVFIKPGLESVTSTEHRYTSQDLGVLLEKADLESLDARLRLGSNQMARDEDRIVEARLAEPLQILSASRGHPSEWMTQAFYADYSLRDSVPERTWRAIKHAGAWTFEMQEWSAGKEPWTGLRLNDYIERAGNDWLAWDLDELAEACQELGIRPEKGLEFQAPHSEGDSSPVWDKSFGFWLA